MDEFLVILLFAFGALLPMGVLAMTAWSAQKGHPRHRFLTLRAQIVTTLWTSAYVFGGLKYAGMNGYIGGILLGLFFGSLYAFGFLPLTHWYFARGGHHRHQHSSDYGAKS